MNAPNCGLYEFLEGARALPAYRRALVWPLRCVPSLRARLDGLIAVRVILDKRGLLRGARLVNERDETLCLLCDEHFCRVKRFILPPLPECKTRALRCEGARLERY